MGATTSITGATAYALQNALSGYSDEAYTNAKKLVGTGIVSGNPKIDKNTETFVGQMRWFKPLNPTINIASLTDSTDGTVTDLSSDFSTYVKSVRTAGARKINVQEIVTQEDGLAKMGRDMAETRAQDEHNALLAILKGVAISEALNGAATGSGATGLGGQSFTNDDTDKKYGFYVDFTNVAPIQAASSSLQGAARAQYFLDAIGKAWKDYEPDYAYLACSPEVIASLRSANLIDQDRVSEANVNFETLFNGKFRIISTRASQSMSSAELTKVNTGGGVDITGTKTSFIILPGAIAMEPLTVPVPVEISRDASAYKGGGTTEVWNRWGFVMHPAGYTWKGSEERFASDAQYKQVVENAAFIDLTAATNGLITGSPAYVQGVWQRKATSALSLGILPIFHG